MNAFTSAAAIAGAAALTVAMAGAWTRPLAAAPPIVRHVVVAELFTSEGCSSCPPADALLQHISSASPVDGVEVVALAEHVDYWDRLGWRDPFSSALFTSRQYQYAREAFRSGNIYTPQLVIDGTYEAVGSDSANVRSAIIAAASRPAADVRVAAIETGDGVRVEVAIDTSSLGRPETADVVVAIVEGGLTSRVERGENRGRTLQHSAVVRSLQAIGELPRGGRARTVSGALPLAAEWRSRQVRVVGFVQERASLRILGAAATALPPRSPSHEQSAR